MLLFLACMMSQLEPATSPSEITLEVFIKASETAKKGHYDKLIAEAQAKVLSNKQVALKPRLKAQQKELIERVEQLKRQAVEPAVDYAGIHLESLAVGGIGRVEYLDWGINGKQGIGLKILQIINETSLLGEVDGRIFHVNKIKTKGLVDDGAFYLPGIWWVNGTYRYETVTGAKKTLFALAPWEHEAEYREWAKKQTPEVPKKAPQANLKADELAKTESAKWHTWKIADKEIRAKYSGINSGEIKLVTEDGRTLKLLLTELTMDEQEWVQAKPWNSPPMTKATAPK